MLTLHDKISYRFHDEDLNNAPPSYQGYLQKEGGGRSFFGRKTWKKRWFVISGVRLGLFKNQKAFSKGQNPIKNRWINLEDYRVEQSLHSPVGIRLVPMFSYMRLWYFKASNEGERDAWVDAFATICSRGIMNELVIDLVGASRRLKHTVTNSTPSISTW